MMEVFVAYTLSDRIEVLDKTLEAWDIDGLEPVVLEMKVNKFELQRRVTAENLSRGNYVLAVLGFGPTEQDFGELAEAELRNNPNAGLIALAPAMEVAICRKGVISHWPTPKTETYMAEHVEAYRFKGYKYIVCPKIHYHPLIVSLPC